jgi:hypothetical protein
LLDVVRFLEEPAAPAVKQFFGLAGDAESAEQQDIYRRVCPFELVVGFFSARLGQNQIENHQVDLLSPVLKYLQCIRSDGRLENDEPQLFEQFRTGFYHP